ncbi:rod shape-determining protein MreD [Pedococcus sp. 5OH_020]|uniref:rod shape-determining protein MreD n=1 Tax=Pedococcus sp. 5OH_020 TaxID=2989814 RepID=UPI0022E9BB92|nr:rod shape-determining protein MreD [Pedococcus sp. 5OH_020]
MRTPTRSGLLRLLLLVATVVLSGTVTARTARLSPDLVMPVVVAAALWSGPTRGALFGLGAGWVVDLVPPGASTLGSSALLYAACGLVAGAGRREGSSPWAWLAVVGAAASAVGSLGRALVALGSGAPLLPVELAGTLLLTCVLCAVAVPPLLRVEHALARRRTT